jgi:hypothetical protein
MEKLSREQRELVKKMKMTTLAAKLVRAGMSEEQIETMDREALMEAWAQGCSGWTGGDDDGYCFAGSGRI